MNSRQQTVSTLYHQQEIWILARAQLTPDQTAISFNKEKISFSALKERAQARAKELRSLGLGQGQTLAVLLENGPLFVELLHAAILCGVRFMPLNTRHTDNELKHPLVDSRATLLVCAEGELHAKALKAADATDCTQICFLSPGSKTLTVEHLQSEKTFTACDQSLLSRFDDSAVLAIIYTSGTSGKSKGVMLSYQNMRASCLSSALNLQTTESDSWLACMPMFHIGGLAILLRSVFDGFTVELMERFDAVLVAEKLRTSVTLASLVPAMLQRIIAFDRDKLSTSKLRAILLGGSATDPAQLRTFTELAYPVLQSYGLTEACSQVATEDIDQPGGLRILNGFEVRVLDTEGKLLSAGAEGEIVVRGPAVMLGYLNNEVQTTGALQNGWLHTGDIGFYDSAGCLHILDRRTDLIISGGENIYPSEVEAVLKGHPQVLDAWVYGEADAAFGQRVMANVKLQSDSILVEKDLQNYCRIYLAGYKVPVKINTDGLVKRTETGKLIRDKSRTIKQ
jgi:O-succinylbenzoic acid--CoA ligase